MDVDSIFRSRQIVFLENQGERLYTEVIQVIPWRQMSWVRPLMLVEFPRLYDLRSSSDLLWPTASFRPALDTEVVPLLVQLASLEPQSNLDSRGQQQFSQFIHQAWQSLPSVYR